MATQTNELKLTFSPESKELYEAFYRNPWGVMEYNVKEYYNGKVFIIKDVPFAKQDIIAKLKEYKIPVKYHDSFIAILHYLFWIFRKKNSDDSEINISEWQDFESFISGWFHDKIKPTEICLRGNKPDGTPYDVIISRSHSIYIILAALTMIEGFIQLKKKEEWDVNNHSRKKGRPKNESLRFTIFLSTKALKIILNFKLVETKYQAEKLFAELFQLVGIIKEDSPYPYDIAKKYFKQWRNKLY